MVHQVIRQAVKLLIQWSVRHNGAGLHMVELFSSDALPAKLVPDHGEAARVP